MPPRKTTVAFVDSASLHDAFGALIVGRKGSWNEWGGRNLLDITWLFLFDNVTVIPGPGHRGSGAIPGYEQRLARRMPSLVAKRHAEAPAVANTKRWLRHRTGPLQAAWQKSRSEPPFQEWATQLRELWWPVHSAANGGLFNLSYLESLSGLLAVSEGEIRRLHVGAKPSVVRAWSRGSGGDAAQLAGEAYLAAILIRGKHHEYLARAHGLQLFAHQFRESLSRQAASADIPPTNSEQMFAQMLVGSALLERTADRRVDRWIENVMRARTAIQAEAFRLPDAIDDRDSLRSAADAARAIELPGASRSQIELLDWAIAEFLKPYLPISGGLF